MLKGDPDLGLRSTDDGLWHVDSPGIARTATADDRSAAPSGDEARSRFDPATSIGSSSLPAPRRRF
jgi:hypothetical protein